MGMSVRVMSQASRVPMIVAPVATPSASTSELTIAMRLVAERNAST